MTDSNPQRVVICCVLVLLAHSSNLLADTRVFEIAEEGDCLTNTRYLKEAPEPIKAILAYYAYQAGTGCEKSDSNNSVRCQLTTDLGLGDQCSNRHISMLNRWFAKDNMGEDYPFAESSCYSVPEGATVSQKITAIDIIREQNNVVVTYDISGWNNREERGWNERSRDIFTITNNKSIKLVKHVVLSKNQDK